MPAQYPIAAPNPLQLAGPDTPVQIPKAGVVIEDSDSPIVPSFIGKSVRAAAETAIDAGVEEMQKPSAKRHESPASKCLLRASRIPRRRCPSRFCSLVNPRRT